MKFSLILLLCAFCALVITCKKNDQPKTASSSDTLVTYSVDSASVVPGEFVTITSTVPITVDSFSLSISGQQINIFKADSFHYALLTPVLAAGVYNLDFTAAKGAKTIALTVGNYSAIADAGTAISTTIQTYNALADSVALDTADNPNAVGDAAFLTQMASALTVSIGSLTSDQQELLAYCMQYYQVTTNVRGQNTTNGRGRVVLGGPNVLDNDDAIVTGVFSQLYAYLSANARAITAAGPAVLSTFAAFAAPELAAVLVPIAIVADLSYISYVKQAQHDCAAAVSIPFIALSGQDENDNGIADPQNAITTYPGYAIWQRYIMKFRSLQQSDENSSISTISTAIQAAYQLQIKDQSIQEIIDNLKARFASFFAKIKAIYVAFTSPVPIAGVQGDAEAQYGDFSVASTSNGSLSVQTSTSTGTEGLALTVTDPANDITTAVNYTITLSYNQAQIDNTVQVVQQATFTPGGPSIFGTWYGSYTPGGPAASNSNPVIGRMDISGGAGNSVSGNWYSAINNDPTQGYYGIAGWSNAGSLNPDGSVTWTGITYVVGENGTFTPWVVSGSTLTGQWLDYVYYGAYNAPGVILTFTLHR